MSEQETVQEVAEALPEKERKIIVDLWKTRMHGEIIGIKQKEEHMAKSRQFNRDLELFGEVREVKKGEEETVGYLGYRKGLWDDEKDKLKKLEKQVDPQMNSTITLELTPSGSKDKKYTYITITPPGKMVFSYGSGINIEIQEKITLDHDSSLQVKYKKAELLVNSTEFGVTKQGEV